MNTKPLISDTLIVEKVSNYSRVFVLLQICFNECDEY